MAPVIRISFQVFSLLDFDQKEENIYNYPLTEYQLHNIFHPPLEKPHTHDIAGFQLVMAQHFESINQQSIFPIPYLHRLLVLLIDS